MHTGSQTRGRRACRTARSARFQRAGSDRFRTASFGQVLEAPPGVGIVLVLVSFKLFEDDDDEEERKFPEINVKFSSTYFGLWNVPAAQGHQDQCNVAWGDG